MNPIRILQLGFIVAAAIFVYSFVTSAQDARLREPCVPLCAMHPNYAGDTRTAPEIELKDLQGRAHRLSDSLGKTTVLVFWSTTCVVCKRQMPSVVELADSIRSDPRFSLVTVAVDSDPVKVRQTIQSTVGEADPFPVWLDPESTFVLGKYGTRLFPETWIIDPDGVIRARFDGARDWSSGAVISLLETVARGNTCPVTLHAGNLSGKAAALCEHTLRSAP